MKVKCAYDKIVELTELKPNPKNPNQHSPEQIRRLAKIMQYQGVRAPITVSTRSKLITKGHGRLAAAQILKMKRFPVDYQDYESEEQEYADMVADNEIARWAETEREMVLRDIEGFEGLDLELLGMKDLVIEEVFEPQADEDEVPEVVEPRTRLGDVYQLGRHRLMCGDSTSIDAVEKLMNGEKADITFTSPPYNAGNTPGENGKYLNDPDDKDSEEYLSFLKDFTTTCLTQSSYVFVNIQSLSGNKTALIDYLYELKSVYADTIIWDKENAQPAMANNVLNSQFEYIHIFSDKANRAIGTKVFRGTISNVFRLQSRSDKEFSAIHKATFPVAFAETFITQFSDDSVLDPFGGSGSTLIACEKTNRKCFMMELDPHYCDVIVARWEKYTGQQAILLDSKDTLERTRPVEKRASRKSKREVSTKSV